MNVVLIISDQHNPEFTGCYGGKTSTPNLDSLAHTGVTFRNAYCTYPMCAPSRASMFTGRYVHELGLWDNATSYDGTLPDWGHHFRDQGLPVTRIGRLDFQRGGDYGFEELIDPVYRDSLDVTGLCRGDYMVRRGHMERKMWEVLTRDAGVPYEPDSSTTQKAVDWLRRKEPSSGPWLLELGYYAPHPRWQPRPELFERYRSSVGPLPAKYYQRFDDLNRVEQVQSYYSCGFTRDDEHLPEIHAAYHATIEELDEQVGRVLTALKERGLYENTLVIYTSDHGEMARAHGAWNKGSLYEDAIRVPFIVSGPGLPRGVIEDTPASLIDIYPTINDSLGLHPARFARGRSLVSTMRGTAPKNDARFIFAECHMYPRITGSYAIRHNGWKLIDYADHRPMLFNLHEDPQELNDLLASDPDSDAVRRRLDELSILLYSMCSVEAVDRQAVNDQKWRRRELEASGRMQQELRKRGFVWEDDRLVYVDE